MRPARLAVSRKEQKKGYGELLLPEAVHRSALIAEQARVIGLFVNAKDDAAKSFYQRFEFLAIPKRPLLLFLPIETLLATV